MPGSARDLRDVERMQDTMLDHEKARRFGKPFPDRGGPVPATIAELTALSLLAPPCCGHIALCDGACRDARPGPGAFRAGWRDLPAKDDPR